MLDIRSRCGLARTGTLNADSLEIRIPSILYFVSPRFPPPPFAEALVASDRVADSRPVIADRGSGFLPRVQPDGLSIAPDIPIWSATHASHGTEQRDVTFKVVGDAQDVTPESAAVLIIGGSAALLREPREFVERICQLRVAAGPNRLLYAPGIALPSNLAMLVYCGIELLDSLAVLFESSNGQWLSQDGAKPRGGLTHPPCRCSACLSGGGREALVDHNQAALWEEMELVRSSIESGQLRELAERRAVNSPWNTAVLRHMDLRHYDFQERYSAVNGGRLKAYSCQSLNRPEIIRFRNRINERYLKPPSAAVLLLLPCSARKPYSQSRSHRMFREAIAACGNPWAIHEVIVTSPLGIVPRELELTYPAAHYDIPVTGDWTLDEAAIVQGDLASFLTKNKYRAIVAHLDVERRFVEGILGDAEFSCRGRATDATSLAALADVLRQAVDGMPKVSREQRAKEDMTSFAGFQFGRGGTALLKDARLHGRYPEIKILRDKDQLAMLSERGLLSLTLDGGRVLSELNTYFVEIEDFYMQGSLFAVGVEHASEEIRGGDDVVIRHGEEVRGVGVAQMSAQEMIGSARGEAVKVRHALRSKPI